MCKPSVRSQEFYVGLSVGFQEPTYLCHHCCFSRHIRREQDWEWSSQDSIKLLGGLQMYSADMAKFKLYSCISIEVILINEQRTDKYGHRTEAWERA